MYAISRIFVQLYPAVRHLFLTGNWSHFAKTFTLKNTGVADLPPPWSVGLFVLFCDYGVLIQIHRSHTISQTTQLIKAALDHQPSCRVRSNYLTALSDRRVSLRLNWYWCIKVAWIRLAAAPAALSLSSCRFFCFFRKLVVYHTPSSLSYTLNIDKYLKQPYFKTL